MFHGKYGTWIRKCKQALGLSPPSEGLGHQPTHIFAILLFHEVTGITEITFLCRSLSITFYNNEERQQQAFIWKPWG